MRLIQGVLLCGLFILSVVTTGYAQSVEKADNFQSRIPKDLLKDDHRFLTLTLENDMFASSNDQNYTHGTRLTYFDVGMESPDIIAALDCFLPFFTFNETTSVAYSIGQNLYTPDNIQRRIPDPNDRPYAGFLYGSAGFSTVNADTIDSLELTLGVIGPWSLGEEVQETVHDFVGADDPSGWDHQLKNELGVILSWQRNWPEIYATDISDFHFRVSPHIGASLGNLYTSGAGGVTLPLTPKKDQWQAPPARVRPSIPGNGFFAVPDNHFAWTAFIGLDGRAFARNIFLDGNSFRDSPSVDKKPFVGDASAGISLTYGAAQISYTVNWRSKEFDGQDDASLFGAVSVGYRF
ncbi:MAG: lipid A deacylase LpxR family protein [Pseudomonadota bacterium]|nr:lipid A deacylase LpxR family protein [Pseudomonadota bacterium]